MPGGVDWRFPALLIAAMLLGLVLTYIQMRSYNAEVNKALRAASGEHLMLVTGRGRSFRGGAIVILIVDTISREIIFARGMHGATVFARFHDLPRLLGPLDGAADRVNGKQLKAAIQMALGQVRTSTPPDSPAASLDASQADSNERPVEDRGARTMRRRNPSTTNNLNQS